MATKYVIELSDDVQFVAKVGVTASGNVYSLGEYKADLEELTADYINEHFGDLQDTAYQRGLEKGYERGLTEGKKAFDLLDAERDAEYQRGFEDGKAVSDKGCEGCRYVVMGSDTTICAQCCNAYHNQWTAKQTDDEIKVGDEVYCKGDDTSDSGVVTWVGKKRVCAMWQDGSAGEVEKDELIKTNRHFDIASILKEMQS